MLLSLRENGLTSLFKEVRVFKAIAPCDCKFACDSIAWCTQFSAILSRRKKHRARPISEIPPVLLGIP